MNGSSSTSRCDNAAINTCTQPSSSVLFDGIIPDVSRISSNPRSWASQLFTFNEDTDLILDFANVAGFVRAERVEIVFFNCPEWGLSLNFIEVYQAVNSNFDISSTPQTGAARPSGTSCNSLIRVCVTVNIFQPVVILHLETERFTTNWIHLAEIEFFSLGRSCNGRNGVVSPRSAEDAPVVTVSVPNQQGSSSSSSCSCSATGYVLTAFITAVVTAVVAAVLFLLIQIALCKCYPNSTDRPNIVTYKKMVEEKSDPSSSDPSSSNPVQVVD